MELLVPGLILVALMVYASTRIKKYAAEAFQAETFEGNGFALEKPDGFLSVVGGDPTLEFEAYSREFGGDGAEEFRQARIEIRRLVSTGLDDWARGMPAGAATTEVIDSRRYMILESERTDKGIAFIDFFKAGSYEADVLELKVIALAETNPDIARKIQEIVTSFSIK